MSDVLELSDDVLSVILHTLTPLDILSISQTCLYLHDLCNPLKHFGMNKYWQYQCQQQWRQVNHNCTKCVDYSCGINEKNYNFYHLFQSIANFVLKMSHNFEMYQSSVEYQPQKPKFQQRLSTILNMDLTMNELRCSNTRNRLSDIIAQDNVDLFKIWLCTMRAKNDDFTINSPVKNLESSNHCMSPIAKCILSAIVTEGATKIATFVLGSHDEKLGYDDEVKPDNNNHNYNFANIDLNISIGHFNDDTVLTVASFQRWVKIVSLLINHPNMTKELINECDLNSFTPLHYALAKFVNAGESGSEKGVKIVELLVKDKRTNLNGVDINGETPLMMAVQLELVHATRCVSVLLDDDRCHVNIQNPIGNTALHLLLCETNCDSSIVSTLLERTDLDVTVKNDSGATPLDLAKKMKVSSEIITMLEKRVPSDHQIIIYIPCR